MFIACTKCSSIPEGGHLCREPQSWCLKGQWLEQWQWSVFQQPWASRLLLPQSLEAAAFSAAQEGLPGSEVVLSHEGAVPSLTPTQLLHYLKTNFHSKLDGFKINCLKEIKSNLQKTDGVFWRPLPVVLFPWLFFPLPLCNHFVCPCFLNNEARVIFPVEFSYEICIWIIL